MFVWWVCVYLLECTCFRTCQQKKKTNEANTHAHLRTDRDCERESVCVCMRVSKIKPSHWKHIINVHIKSIFIGNVTKILQLKEKNAMYGMDPQPYETILIFSWFYYCRAGCCCCRPHCSVPNLILLTSGTFYLKLGKLKIVLFVPHQYK